MIPSPSTIASNIPAAAVAQTTRAHGNANRAPANKGQRKSTTQDTVVANGMWFTTFTLAEQEEFWSELSVRTGVPLWKLKYTIRDHSSTPRPLHNWMEAAFTAHLQAPVFSGRAA